MNLIQISLTGFGGFLALGVAKHIMSPGSHAVSIAEAIVGRGRATLSGSGSTRSEPAFVASGSTGPGFV